MNIKHQKRIFCQFRPRSKLWPLFLIQD